MGPANGRLLSGRGLTRAVLDERLSGKPAFVVDRHAPAIVSTGERVYELDGGERVKSMAELERLLSWLSAAHVERSDPLVVVGGGTAGDLVGRPRLFIGAGFPS